VAPWYRLGQAIERMFGGGRRRPEPGHATRRHTIVVTPSVHGAEHPR
jgi:hypothetical protein